MYSSLYCVLYCVSTCTAVNWLEWWTYDGISGPSFWGLINPEWSLCNQGLRQSPIDLVPEDLLYDPSLEELFITPNKVQGKVFNTGHTATFKVDPGNHHLVNITGGPLSYHYQVSSVVLHWGEDIGGGSEHTVDGHAAALEVQVLGYNGQLYNSESSSLRSPNGGVGIAVLVQLGEKTNPELEKIIKAASSLKYAGSSTSLSSVSLSSLVSTTSHMITYEGSLTQPGCQESVTWIIPNKPIYVQAEHMMLLSNLMQGTEDDPRAPLAGNLRPIQQTHGRMVRTNIHFDNNQDVNCREVSNPLSYTATSAWTL